MGSAVNNAGSGFDRMKTSASSFGAAGAGAFDGAVAGARRLNIQLDETLAKIGRVGDRMRNVGRNMTLGVTLPVIGGGMFAINQASDLNEELSKNQKLFGDHTSALVKWSETSNTALGLSQQEALAATGTYGNLFTAMGMGQKQAAGLSMDLVGLTGDFASFNNTTSEMANTALQAGLIGEYEGLRKYGIVLNAATVEAKALDMGLGGVNGMIDEQDKLLARHALIMEQSVNAQGDFIRTSGDLANQKRILSATIKDVAASFGEIMLPAALKAVSVLATMLERVDSLSPGMKRLVVGIAAGAAALGPLLLVLGTMAGAIAKLGPVIRGVALAFGLIGSPVGLIAAGVAIAGILAYRSNFMGFGDAVRGVFGKITDVVGDVVDTFDDAVDAFRDVWNVADDVTVMFGAFALKIDSVNVSINGLSRFLYSLGAAFGALGLDTVAGWFTSLGDAIDELVQRFQGLRSLGLDPVSAALIAIGTTFETLGPLMNDIAGIVDNVTDAFSSFMAGDFSAGFVSLGEAAKGALSALQSIGNLALDVVVSIGSWIIEQAGDLSTDIQNWLRLNSVGIIGNIAGIVVNVAGWVKGTVEDIWGAIKGWVFGGGNQGDGTGGATNAGVSGRSISIAGIAVNVTKWARGKIDDLWTAIKGFVVGGTGSVEHVDGQAIGGPNAGAITVSDVSVNIANWVKGTFPEIVAWIKAELGPIDIADVAWSLTLSAWDAFITITDSIAEAVAAKIGSFTAYILDWGVNLTADMDIVDAASLAGKIGLAVAALGIALVALPLLLPIAIGLGAVTIGLYLLGRIVAETWAWVQANPLTVMEMMLDIDIILGNIAKGLLLTDIYLWLYTNVITPFQDNPVDFVMDVLFSLGEIITDISTQDLIDGFMDHLGIGGGLLAPIKLLPSFSLGAAGNEQASGGWQEMAGPVGMEMPGGRGKGAKGGMGSGMFAGLLAEIESVTTALTTMGTRIATITVALSGFYMGMTPIVSGLITMGMTFTQLHTVLTTLVSGLITTGLTFTQLYTVMTTIVSGLITLGLTFTQLYTVLTTTVSGLITLGMTFTQLYATMPPVVSGLITVGATFTQFYTVLTTIVSGLITTGSTFTQLGTVITTFGATVLTAMSAVKTAVTTNMLQATSSVRQNTLDMQTLVRSAGNSMKSSMSGAMEDMARSAASGAQRAASAVRRELGVIPGIVRSIGASGASAAYSAGAEISQGFASGMRSALGSIERAADAMVSAANRAVRARARIASPSKMFAELGNQLGEGFAIGIDQTIPLVISKATQMVDLLKDVMSASMPNPMAGLTGVFSEGARHFKREMGVLGGAIIGDWEQLTQGFWRNVNSGMVYKGIRAEDGSYVNPGFYGSSPRTESRGYLAPTPPPQRDISTARDTGATNNYYIVMTKQELEDVFDTVEGFKVLTSPAEIRAAVGRG